MTSLSPGPRCARADLDAFAFDFLPGVFTLSRGAPADYRVLARFHYAAAAPATWAGVWVVRWSGETVGGWGGGGVGEVPNVDRPPMPPPPPHLPTPPVPIAVGVLSYPTPSCRARARHFHLTGPRYGDDLRWINAHLRTISRVIVHPRFRALGLATRLVRRMLDECPTRYVETIATMAHFVPLFERAGMREVGRGSGEAERGSGEVGGWAAAAADDAGAARPAYFVHDRSPGTLQPPTDSRPCAGLLPRLAAAPTPRPTPTPTSRGRDG